MQLNRDHATPTRRAALLRAAEVVAQPMVLTSLVSALYSKGGLVAVLVVITLFAVSLILVEAAKGLAIGVGEALKEWSFARIAGHQWPPLKTQRDSVHHARHH
jgi:hypothetical protein